MSRDADMPVPAGLPVGWSSWAAVALLAVLVGIGLAPLKPEPAVAAVAAAVAVGAGALLVWQRQRRYLLPGAAVATAGIVVLADGNAASLGWFAVCLIGIWCALTGPRLDALIYWAGTVALFTAEWLFVATNPGWGAWLTGSTLSVAAGLLVRRERDLVAQLKEAQASLAGRARAEERNRIARELHDVIAHTLTVSLLHVSSARLAVEHGLADAAESLAEAERLGRESLDEVRMAVGILHQDGNEAPGSTRTTPLPGAAELPGLVEQFRAAGATAELTVAGDIDQLPATVGLALYRILQEALTNAVRHAPGAPTAIRIDIARTQVRMAVETAGPPGKRTGSGFGLLSMRERAEALGGTCSSAPGGRGWLVEASFPLENARRKGER